MVKWVLLSVMLVAGGAAAFAVYEFILKNPPPPVQDKPVVEERAPQRPVPNAIEAEQYEVLKGEWEAVAKAHPASPGYKPLLEEAEAHWKKIDAFWEQGRYREAVVLFEQVRLVMRRVAEMDESRDSAPPARADALAAADLALDADAPQMVPTLWVESEAMVESADKLYREQKYTEAISGWFSASAAYGRATVASEKAKASARARHKFQSRMTYRFPEAVVKKFGGDPLVQALEKFDLGRSHHEALRFDEAAAAFAEADSFVPAMDHEIERAIGAHHFAVQLGYEAAGALLREAAGQAVPAGVWERLQALCTDLGVGAEGVSALAAHTERKPGVLAAGLFEQLPLEVEQKTSAAVKQSFSFGVHVRLVEKMLDTTADAFARQDSTEIRKSLDKLALLGRELGYSEALPAALKAVEASLAIKPEYEAMRRSRDQWQALVRQLEDFDRAMKILPPSVELP